MKRLIWLGVIIGGALGSWLGSLVDGNNWFGFWGMLLGAIGSLAGIWVAYKLSKDYL